MLELGAFHVPRMCSAAAKLQDLLKHLKDLELSKLKWGYLSISPIQLGLKDSELCTVTKHPIAVEEYLLCFEKK